MYQGYENKETFLVYLTIYNSQSLQRKWLSIARECWRDAREDDTWNRDENAAFALRDMLEVAFSDIKERAVDFLEGSQGLDERNRPLEPELDTMVQTFLIDSFKEVNWLEVAKHLLD